MKNLTNVLEGDALRIFNQRKPIVTAISACILSWASPSIAENDAPTSADTQTILLAQADTSNETNEDSEAESSDSNSEENDLFFDLEEVTITGTRLKNESFRGITPVVTISPKISERGGRFSIASALQNSAAGKGSFQLNQQLGATGPGGQVNSGGAGFSGISLRGLGTQRTLVTLNGRRMTPAGVQGEVGSVDLNFIPKSAVERIDIVREGSSSVYGSDAVAGVVDIITKKNYDGSSFSVHTLQPFESGGEELVLAFDFGKTFEKGWFSVAGDYHSYSELNNSERDFLSCSESRLYNPETGERADLLDTEGNFKCRNHNPNGVFFDGSWFGGTFQPDPNGTLIGAPGDATTREFLPEWARVGNFWLDDSQAERASYAPRREDSTAYQNADAISPTDQFNFLVQGEFELSENISVFGSLLYGNRESNFDGWSTLYQGLSPFNPNNTVAEGLINASGGNASGFVLYQAIRPYNFSVDLDYYNADLGIKGDLGNWNWSATTSYGRSDGEYAQTFLYQDRLNAISFGNVACDPFFLNPAVSDASLCDGVNIPVLSTRFLVDQNWTDEETAFLQGLNVGNTVYEQTIVEVTANGELFDLPSGAVEAVVGASYRQDKIDDTPGINSQQANLHLFSSAGRTKGEESVKEVFGEIGLPILNNAPLAHDVNAVLSARYTDYDYSGSETTYKAGINWGLSSFMSLRASTGSSFRGANLYELFLANQTAFNTISDPCENWADSGNNSIRENCEAAGIPDDFRPTTFDTLVVSGGAVLPDGSTSIKPETSDSWSSGLIFNFKETGLSLAVDYFDIQIDNQIDQLGSNRILNACYNDNLFCSFFNRNAADHPTNPFEITQINERFLNIDEQTFRGLEWVAEYNKSFGEVKLETRLEYNYLLEAEQARTIAGEEDVSDFRGRPNRPKEAGTLDASFYWKDWELYYGVIFIGSSGLTEQYEGDTFTFFNGLNGETFREDLETGTQIYHTLSVSKTFDKITATLGVNNIFDRQPPLVSVDWSFAGEFNGSRTGSAAQNSWDLYGRRAFFTLRGEF